MKLAKLIGKLAVLLENEGNVRVLVDVPDAVYDIDDVTFVPDDDHQVDGNGSAVAPLPTVYIGTR
ncbi:hypothetical protein [Actinocrispum wychmicini]|uniref:Uncharacterized protein n=1 Tax=Actinocrispum wychmicini TaxID=1213861 RepID=A0A4R2IS14_9PSEU|nr:hypothetical protein [Actinocrispum wychmicini]TCO47994.1 hypothetical protein EV192_11647 [Actinocrispum wychmicini]